MFSAEEPEGKYCEILWNFVRKDCCGHFKITIFLQFLAIEPHFM